MLAGAVTETPAIRPSTPFSSMPMPTKPAAPRAVEGPVLTLASDADRAAIYRMRHAVYACELGQHPQNAQGELRDALDQFNTYIVAMHDGELAGFISITPPGRRYSVEKYLSLSELPVEAGTGLFEIRLLTVASEQRRRSLAPLLMYAAFRWIESQGGTQIVALGRDEVVDLYLDIGLQPVGRMIQAGAVTYHLLQAGTDLIRARAQERMRLLDRLERSVQWMLPFPFSATPACYHGGAFFEAIGADFDTLERREQIINADVLDAWFPPSPRVLEALREHLPWLVRTSPPTHCEGLVRAIARARGIGPECVLPGGGSSDLIFLALTRWLSRTSRVLILDPMYGEYAHVLEQVVRCRVDRFPLVRGDDYTLDLKRWVDQIRRIRYDLVVLVNPNSPTGQHVPRAALEAALREVPEATRVWVDETYVDYAGPDASLERFAVERSNVVVCKSMSKVYALSGMRVGYLCAAPAVARSLRPYSPPWAVGLPSQLAAVRALEDAAYYRRRWQQTHALRRELCAELMGVPGIEVTPGIANFLLCHLPEPGPDAATVVARARGMGLFLRDAGAMGTQLGTHALRIAVKDADTNRRMVQVLAAVLGGETGVPLAPRVSVSPYAPIIV